MPAVVVPSPESVKADPGQSTKAVGGVGPRNLSNRIANTALSLTFLGGFLFLGGCSATNSASSANSNARTKSSICTRNPRGLSPIIGSTLSTLPPSHDNDVGRMRIPDAHPDADVDANQVPKADRCQRS